MKVTIPEARPTTFRFKRCYKNIPRALHSHPQSFCKLNASYFRDRLCSMSNTTSLLLRSFISFAYDLQNKSFSLLRKAVKEGRLWQLGMFSMMSKNSFHSSALTSLRRTKKKKVCKKLSKFKLLKYYFLLLPTPSHLQVGATVENTAVM